MADLKALADGLGDPAPPVVIENHPVAMQVVRVVR